TVFSPENDKGSAPAKRPPARRASSLSANACISGISGTHATVPARPRWVGQPDARNPRGRDEHVVGPPPHRFPDRPPAHSLRPHRGGDRKSTRLNSSH